MLTHVFANAWFMNNIFVHNTVDSLNLDEDHNIDDLSEGEPQSFKIPDWWVVFQRVTSNVDFKVQHLFPIQNQKRNWETLIETGRNQSVSRIPTAILAGTLKSRWNYVNLTMFDKKLWKSGQFKEVNWKYVKIWQILKWRIKKFVNLATFHNET